MENIKFQNRETIALAFKIYAEKSLDIVDCMLFAYRKNENYNIKTFDIKLKKFLAK